MEVMGSNAISSIIAVQINFLVFLLFSNIIPMLFTIIRRLILWRIIPLTMQIMLSKFKNYLYELYRFSLFAESVTFLCDMNIINYFLAKQLGFFLLSR